MGAFNQCIAWKETAAACREAFIEDFQASDLWPASVPILRSKASAKGKQPSQTFNDFNQRR
jgi:hypothetical protein